MRGSKKTSLLATIMLLAMIVSILPARVYAADDVPIDGRHTSWITVDEDGNIESGDPVVKHYFKDLKSLEYKDAIKIDEMAIYDAFEGIAKEDGKFKPNSILTRKQFRKIIRNLFDVNIKITEPEKPVTRAWAKKQMDRLYRGFGIPKVSTLKGSKKMSRLDASLEIYELFSEFQWSFDFAEVVLLK